MIRELLGKILNRTGEPLAGRLLRLDRIGFEEVFEPVRTDDGEVVGLRIKTRRLKVSDMIYECEPGETVLGREDILLRLRWFDFIGRSFEGIRGSDIIEIVDVV